MEEKRKKETKEIEPESTLSDFQKQKNIKKISLIKKSKTIKCPDCVDNTCFLKIENFRLHFFGCPYGHYIITTFAQYQESQKLNYYIIRCDNCGETGDEVKEMYKCLTCSSKNGVSYYICDNCLNSHITKSGKIHRTIIYDIKNYICLDNCFFSSHCITCQIDICDLCSNLHYHHHIIKYGDIKYEIEKRNGELEEIKRKIDELKLSILQLLKIIDNTYKIFVNYHSICKDILDKYEEVKNTKLKNYHLIENIHYLEKSNKEVIKHLNYLTKEDNSKEGFFKKCGLLIDIYYKERKNDEDKNIKENNNQQKKEVTQNENNNNNPNSVQGNFNNGKSINNKNQ